MRKPTTARCLIPGVVSDDDSAIGLHLVTARLGYTHHGLYAGAGKVVHYAGLSRSLRRGPVDEVTLTEFAQEQPVWIQQSPGAKFPGAHAVQRAYSRLGEDRYRLMSNNCEHFCMWCLYGESRSDQVDAWKSWVGTVQAAAVTAITRLTGLVSRNVRGARLLADWNSKANGSLLGITTP